MSILKYFKDTKIEMKHVTWPTVRQAFIYTGIVIAMAITVSLVLGLFDYLFSLGIQKLIY